MSGDSGSLYEKFYGKDFDDLSSIPEINTDLNDVFYNCKKCFKLPQIFFTPKGEIKFSCECINSKDEKISTEELMNRIVGNDLENKSKLNCYCIEHEMKFQYFCINCEDNKCEICSKKCEDHQHQLVNQKKKNSMNVRRKIIEIKTKIDEIKNDEGYKYFMNDNVEIDGNSINLSDDFTKSKLSHGEKNKEFTILNEQSNDYALLYFFNIIIYNYEEYPNGWHIFNISNCYDFFIQKFFPKEIILTYKNDKSGKIKLVGENFVKNNKENCFFIIGNKNIELCEYYYLGKEENNDCVCVTIKEKKNRRIFDMSYMFHNCNLLINISDKSIWKMNKVNNISYMFYLCSSLKNLPNFISNWDTSEIRDMSYLFYGCSLIEEFPDFSSWNSSKLLKMNNPFYGCKSLQSIPKIDLTNIKNVQKIHQTNNKICETANKISENMEVFLKAIIPKERIFIKIFEAFLLDKSKELYDKNSDGYFHANDALIIALNVDDCQDLDKNFQLLLNSVIREERNFYYIWYLLNKLIKGNVNNCQRFLTEKKLLKIITNDIKNIERIETNVLKKISSLLWKRKKLNLFALNKKLQDSLSINKDDYIKLKQSYKIIGENGKGKEFSLYENKIIFEGEYLNGKRNGKGKEYYYYNNIIKFEGMYLKGEKISGNKYDINGNIILELENGKGKEFYDNGKIQFEGKYLNGKRWNGKGYNYNGQEEFAIKYGKGNAKEYDYNGEIKFEGEYLNGLKNGEGI